MAGRRAWRAAAVMSLGLISPAAAAMPASLPYTPTTLLIPGTPGLAPQDTIDIIYAVVPQDSSVGLLSLNFSSGVSSSGANFQSISPALKPTGSINATTAFSASISQDGVVMVYVGDCAAWDSSPSIFSFYPDDASQPGGKGSWSALNMDSGSTVTGGLAAPLKLGGMISFSSVIAPHASNTILYSYGGMCEQTSSSPSAPIWQGNAVYSNRMLKVAPQQQMGAFGSYTITSTGVADPPIADAGFSMTALPPLTNNQSGSVSQQAHYAVLGGHTQDAFVNMSTAALFNLPNETWTYVNISPPGTSSATGDLKKDTVASIDSRSGHTAVLAGNGSALIVLGGWVGDISQAANPQLAVLQLGSGLSRWQWSVPEVQPAGSGIYGHGAVLLPGDVMMVYGGYNITGSSASHKRQATTSQASPMFLDLNTLQWSNAYTNPASQGQTASGGYPAPGSSGTPGSSGSSGPGAADQGHGLSLAGKIGLGLGLGLGLIILGIVGYLLWGYRKQVKSERVARDEAVRSLAQDHRHFLSHPDEDEMIESDGRGLFNWLPTTDRDWYAGGHDPYVRGSQAMDRQPRQSEIRRKPIAPINARGLYHPAHSAYDFNAGRPHASPGNIHPIAEADENEEAEPKATGPGPIVLPEIDTHDRNSLVDPFLTPPATTPTKATVTAPAGVALFRDAATRVAAGEKSPVRDGTHQGHNPEVQDWFSDLDAADALLAARMHAHPNSSTASTVILPGPRHPKPGRISPTRRASVRSKTASLVLTHDDDGRTASNISESNRSMASVSIKEPTAVVSRTTSTRSRAVASPSPTHGLSASQADNRPATSGGSSSSSGKTFSTAKSSFPVLQAEGPALLLGKDDDNRSGVSSQGTRSRSNTAGTISRELESDEAVVVPGSPSKSKPRTAGLWNNFKRVFSASGISPGSSSRRGSPVQAKSLGPDALTPGSVTGGADYESPLSGMSVLAGGRLQRRRQQGREAWHGDSGTDAERSFNYRTGLEAGHGDVADDSEEDWDIERAVEQRLVQVMFTVPKERLRVVNADAVSLRRDSGQTATPEEREATLESAVEAPLMREETDIGELDQSLEEEKLPKSESEKMPVTQHAALYHDTDNHELLEDVFDDHKSHLFDDEEETAFGTDLGDKAHHDESLTHEFKGLTPPPAAHLQESKQKERDLLVEDAELGHHEYDGPDEHVSASPFRIADDLRLEKPRTKVLEMVDNIEGRSRSGSPETPSRRRTGGY